MKTSPTPTDLQAILKVNGYEPRQAQFLNVIEIVPNSLQYIFDEGIWDNAPFSMGDSVYTLVDAITIRNWIQDFVDEDVLPKRKQKDYVKLIELLNLCFDAQVYINVE